MILLVALSLSALSPPIFPIFPLHSYTRLTSAVLTSALPTAYGICVQHRWTSARGGCRPFRRSATSTKVRSTAATPGQLAPVRTSRPVAHLHPLLLQLLSPAPAPPPPAQVPLRPVAPPVRPPSTMTVYVATSQSYQSARSPHVVPTRNSCQRWRPSATYSTSR